VIFVDILDIATFSHVEDYPHDSLSGTHWAVNLGVYLINTDRITFSDKSVEDVFTESLSFNDDFLLLRMNLLVEGCESIDAVGALGYSGRD
jgi:hypothetical protein